MFVKAEPESVACMKVTINDIAKAAQVAKSTVSKVINNSPTISEATRNRVLDIMREMQFTPNSVATQLAKQQSYTVGLVIDMERRDDFLNPFFYSIIGGVESVVGARQYDLTISNIRNRETDVLQRFVYNRKLDGLILHALTAEPRVLMELDRLSFPYVVVGKPSLDIQGPWVDADNAAGGEMAASHLLERGYRRIAFIGGNFEEPLAASRLEGFMRIRPELERHNALVHSLAGPSDEASGYRMMLELLDGETPPDSAICINNYVAFGALKALRERGIGLPDQFGMVAFDDYPLAPYTSPAMSCLHIDTFEIGARAAGLLLDRIQDPSGASLSPIAIRPRLIPRGTTAR